MKLKAAGARASTLPVSAPFHSTLMEPAEARLREDIDRLAFSDPRVPVYVNVDATPITDAEAAKDALIRQVSRPVLWVARIDKTAGRVSVQGPSDFAAAKEAIAEARAS